MRPARAALGAAALAVPLAWLVHRNLIDDVFITLSHAGNLASDLHWGLIPTETSNSATSPLNVGVLAVAADEAIGSVLREPGARVVADAGDVPWTRRAALKRQEARIIERHEAGEIDDLEGFLDVTGIREELGADVAVVSVPE